MRITAIRGSNLASLAGDFEVVLDQGPLGQVGLFAITGPTGAGKSTLLDAACLALFDRIPRLRVASRNSRVRASLDEDAEALTATDPRLCLRRGAGEGWAEVEFLDASGARFRARWSVHRARKQPDGRVQNSEMALYDAEDVAVAGGRKTDVLEAIEERLGLGFEQFRRAALLAQGEFAAFLHAEPTERATVLERVTGTELYRQIGEAVFERFRTEEAALRELERRLEDVGVLPEETRQALVARQGELARGAEVREQSVLQANRALAWYAREHDLEVRLQSAREELAAAESAFEAAAGERGRLAALDAVEPLRGVFEQAREREQAVVRARSEVERLTGALEARTTASTRASEAEAHARAALTTAEAAREAIEADLGRARSEDARLHELRRARDQAAKERDQAEGQVTPLAGQVQELDARLEAAVARAQQAEAWFEANPRAAERLRRGEELDRGLQRLAQARERLTEARTRQADLTGRRERAQREADRAATAHREAEAAQVTARRSLEAASSALADLDAEAIERRSHDLAEERSHLEILRGPAQRAADAAQRLTEAAEELDRIARRTQEVESERREIADALVRDGIRLEEARATLDRLRGAVGLETRRGELEEGEPCPLCGSTHHPWKEEGAPTSAVVRDQQARVDELDRDRLTRERRQAALTTEVAQLDQGRSRAEQTRQRAQADQERAQAAWSQAETPDGVEPLGDAPDLDAVGERLERCVAAERALVADRRALSEARQAVERSRARQDEATRAEAQTAQRFHAAKLHYSQIQQQAETATRDASQAGIAATEAATDLEILAELVADALDAVEVDTLRGALHRERDVALAHQQALEQQARAREHDAPRREALRARLHAAEEQARLALERHARAEADVLRATQARAQLLDGRPVEAVEAHHRQVLQARRQAVEQAVERARQAESEASAAKARLEEARRDEVESDKAHQRSQAELTAAAEQAGVGMDVLRERLAVPTEAVSALRARLADLDAKQVRATTVLQEREQALQLHRESDENPGIERERIEAALGQLEQAKRAAQAERADVDAEIKRDADARSRADKLASEQAEQAARLDTWARLAKLIGSRDGRAFKRFAQSLTLDSLLVFANYHLDDLAPRYRLVRVPGSELDLQVIDRHMGDEVRGVHTLSGGESFLASLALALGLASLSSAETPVDTLFIDEGFGTLDRETLDTALAALDALQATGRQVGIISHVSGLAERIGTQVRVIPTGAGRSRVEVSRGA